MGVEEKLERLSYQAKCQGQKMVSALLHTMSLLVSSEEDGGDNFPVDPVERYEDELCAILAELRSTSDERDGYFLEKAIEAFD